MLIRHRMIWLFQAMILIPIVFIGLLNFSNARHALVGHIQEKLDAVADLKVEESERFFERLKADMGVLQGSFNIQTHLPVLSCLAADPANPDYIKARMTLDRQMQTWVSVKDELANLILFDAEGRMVYAATALNSEEQTLIERHDIFEQGRRGLYVSPVFQNVHSASYRFGMLMAAPLYDAQQNFIGVGVFEVNMKAFYRFIQDTNGLGQTGETLVVEKRHSRRGTPDDQGRDGDYAVFLSPLRYDARAALKRVAFLGETQAVPAQRAVSGENGHGISFDYRGREILASWRYMPALRWGLVAKMDMDEVLASVRALGKLTIFICLITALVVGLVAWAVADMIFKPLASLQKKADLIGIGQLDQQTGISSPDEIGGLARAVDQMTVNLRTSIGRLEEEIAAREQAQAGLERTTQELEQMNKELTAFNAHVVDREVRMVELKGEINRLSRELGRQPPYDLSGCSDDEEAAS